MAGTRGVFFAQASTVRWAKSGSKIVALSSHRSGDHANPDPDGLEESSPDHETKGHLDGKSEGPPNEVTQMKRLVEQRAHNLAPLQVRVTLQPRPSP